MPIVAGTIGYTVDLLVKHFSKSGDTDKPSTDTVPSEWVADAMLMFGSALPYVVGGFMVGQPPLSRILTHSLTTTLRRPWPCDTTTPNHPSHPHSRSLPHRARRSRSSTSDTRSALQRSSPRSSL